MMPGAFANPPTGIDQPHAIADNTQSGPDLIVSMFTDITNYAYQQTESGLISNFVVGPQVCSVGDEPIHCEGLPSPYHYMLRSALYRLKGGRFEQLGISWVYHGYLAVNDSMCGMDCTAPANHDGSLLYPGCSDVHAAGIPGISISLSQASGIDANTATFDYPVVHPAAGGGRIQVHNSDLDPALNPNSLYFVEMQGLSPDDAAAGKSNNNATHQRVNVRSATASPNDSCTGSDPQRYCLFLTGSVYDSQPAIRAWKNSDPDVVETYAQVPDEGLFILAANASDLGSGLWSYEYALHNLNSDRSGQSFSLPLAIGAKVDHVGFHDVDYHGEPYDGTDWQFAEGSGRVSWNTQEFDENQNANALRWGTLYNFRFVSNLPPAATVATLGLFKPGEPKSMAIATIGPTMDPTADGDFDLADYQMLTQCFREGTQLSESYSIQCLAYYDLNPNGVIDLADWSGFQPAFSGPTHP